MDELSQLAARTGELEEFVIGIAALAKDGELPGRPDVDQDSGEGKVWENDDAFDTLHDLISDARRLMLPTRQHVTNSQTDQTTGQASSQTGEGDPPD